MTVEQPVRTSYSRQSRENADIAKIVEVTGIKDYSRISEAICQCKNEKGTYELEDVITVLLTQTDAPAAKTGEKSVPINVTHVTTTESATSPSKPAVQEGGKPKKEQGVIDLTSETVETDDLQKAIAASLKETQGILGGQVSREEQEISRALEASLAENKAGTKRKRGDIWFVDPLNPHERKREENCPVGLKNVGNTCWFSAVVQSLFHIPLFRQLVLNYVPPPHLTKDGCATEKHKFEFMSELRYLFGLMVASRRKYVDPSRPVEILKEAFSPGVGSVDNQQDVSEFQHKLLEWLEDAFRTGDHEEEGEQAEEEHGASGPSCPVQRQRSSNNPMVQLFYGQVLAEGSNEGKKFRNTENFGQFPLQVDGFLSIHDSLEAATGRGQIESVTGDVTALSVQEQWFTCLPPVLTFELSRFHFNQQLGRPEKIHNKLEFPEIIYLDRYMEINKDLTRQKREELRLLREKLSELHRRLDKFVNYGSGPKRFPLQDVLQYALEFAESAPSPHASPAPDATPLDSPPSTSTEGGRTSPSPQNCSESSLSEVEMESPKSQVSIHMESPSRSPLKTAVPPDITMHTPPRGVPTSPSPLSPTPSGSQGPPKHPHAFPDNPTPRHITQEELEVLQTCLQRWREEVGADVKELQDSIGELDEKVNGMYREEKFRQNPYKLHAVLVHEGQAASGHYWAYVYSHSYKSWLKFNDIAVTEVLWEDVQRESVGGYHNASAYCLMYVGKKHDLLEDGDNEETGQRSRTGLDSLPPDLQIRVQEDNQRFAREIMEWDNEQQKRLLLQQQQQISTPVGSPASPASSSSSMEHDNKQAVTVKRTPVATGLAGVRTTLPQTHAQLSSKATFTMVSHVLESDTFKNKGAAAAFLEACRMEMKRLDNIFKTLEVSLPSKDPRLSHVVLYLRANHIDGITQRALVEQFAFCSSLDSNPESQQIRLEAQKQLEEMKRGQTAEHEREYMKWHECYSRFRQTNLQFLAGLQMFLSEKFVEALPHLMYACDLNAILVKNERHLKGLNPLMLSYFRRVCLLRVNDIAARWFEGDEKVKEALCLMTGPILSCVSVLSGTPYQDDQCAIEEVREKWCSFLGKELGAKQEKLPDFMERLCDPPTDARFPYSENIPRVTDTVDLWRQHEVILKTAADQGFLERALKST